MQILYSDGTWIFPHGYKYLIIILYQDKTSLKRYPGLFALINNKKKKGYDLLFNIIKNIIILENSKDLFIKSY